MQKTVLHVGCGRQKILGTRGFDAESWKEIRLDIDAAVKPDVCASMLDMSAVPDAAIDAILSSHNIEHLYAHEVPVAFREFVRVLRPGGFLVLTCPDLQSVCELVAQGKLLEPAYLTGNGTPIAPLDILFGWRTKLAEGNLFMAHKCGFIRDMLAETLNLCGFVSVVAVRRLQQLDLLAVAVKGDMDARMVQELVTIHH